MADDLDGILGALQAGEGIQLARPKLVGPSGEVLENPFHTDYEQWLVYEIPLGEPNRPRVRIGSSTPPRRCRVCRRSADEGVSFHKAAHIIPQALGNRELVSDEECDECNEWAGEKLEDDLIKLLSPMRALLPLPTKKGGTAKHKLKMAEGSSYLQSKPANPAPITLYVNAQDDSVTTTHDEARQEVRITTKVAPLSMMDVAKSLARMCFLALPADAVDQYEPLRLWFRGEAEFQPVVTEVKIPGTGITRLRLVVYRQRRPVIGQAPLIVALGFGLSVYFCYLPGPTFSAVKDTPLPTFGRSPYPPHDPMAEKMTILADTLSAETTYSFTMRYAKRSEAPPPSDPVGGEEPDRASE